MDPDEDDMDEVFDYYASESDPELSSEDMHTLNVNPLMSRNMKTDPWVLEAQAIRLTGDTVRDHELEKHKQALMTKAVEVEVALTSIEREGESYWLRKR